jgi:hypothetical protein
VQRNRHTAAVLGDVDPVPCSAGRRQRDGHVAEALQHVPPPVVEQRHGQVVEQIARHLRHVRVPQGAQLAVDAEDRLHSGLQVDVRGAELSRGRPHSIEQGIHRHGGERNRWQE